MCKYCSYMSTVSGEKDFVVYEDPKHFCMNFCIVEQKTACVEHGTASTNFPYNTFSYITG